MDATRMISAANHVIGGAAMGLLLLTSAEVTAADAASLAAKYNCSACHTVDKRVVGPAYKDVAAKYASDPTALAKLSQKVKSGGSGVWGAIPMPPNNVPDAELKTLIEWILALK
jgi:cytochrome c